tara:strand:- start:497 stop:631 length:135 start_codon:yes stop_codon:yes gene_type:complete
MEAVLTQVLVSGAKVEVVKRLPSPLPVLAAAYSLYVAVLAMRAQ